MVRRGVLAPLRALLRDDDADARAAAAAACANLAMAETNQLAVANEVGFEPFVQMAGEDEPRYG